MATTWGGTSIPDPTTWTRQTEHVGAVYLVASGTANTDTVTHKKRYAVQWELITTAQRNTIYGKAIVYTASTLILPGGDSISVKPIAGSYSETPVGVTPAWNVSVEVREA